MSDEGEPRWHMLPRRPAEFFGLAGEYDLTDLKRRYNVFVRRFKPERHPSEFQRIRAAFEALQDALRYGGGGDDAEVLLGFGDAVPPLPQGPAPPTGGRMPWTSPPNTSIPSPGPSSDNENERDRMPLWLNEAPPEVIFSELRRRTKKSPYDYYALAALSDVSQEDPLSFALWLLAGLRERAEDGDLSDLSPRGDMLTGETGHPRHTGLSRLLREYFSRPLALETAEELVWLATKFIRGDWYYWITEPLWLRLLAEAPFERFRTLLARCESRLLDARSDYRASFYLRLLPPAIWKADDAWLRESLDWVEQTCRGARFRGDHPLRTIELLAAYREHRDQFVRTHAACARIDRALEDYYSLGPIESDRAVVECQHHLDALGLLLLDAIPQGNRICSRAVLVWERVSEEVMDRLGEPPVTWRERELALESQRLALDLHRERARRGMTRTRTIVLLGFIFYALVSAGMLLFFAVRLFYQVAFAREWGAARSSLLQLLGVVGAALLAFALLLCWKYWHDRRQYRLVFRPGLFRFLKTAGAPAGDVRNAIASLHNRTVGGMELSACEKIAQRMGEDSALALHAEVQRFLRCAASGGDTGDADLAELLGEYRGARFVFLDGDRVRQRMDELLDAYRQLESDEKGMAFRACQLWLAEHPFELMRALPHGCPRAQRLARTWKRLADDVGTCRPDEPTVVDAAGLESRVSLLIQRLAATHSLSSMQIADASFGLAALALLIHTAFCVVGAGLMALLSVIAGSTFVAAATAIGFAGVLALTLMLLYSFRVARDRIELRSYRHSWRKELFLMASVHSHPLDEVCMQLLHYAEQSTKGPEFPYAERLAELMRGDAGLEIYAIARRFAG